MDSPDSSMSADAGVPAPTWRAALAPYGLDIQPDDDPSRWTSRLRTGLASLAAELAGPRAGIALLARLFPDGPASAGLSERDLWARLVLTAGDAQGALALARERQQVRD